MVIHSRPSASSPQRLAQRCDLDGKVHLLDDGPRPRPLEEHRLSHGLPVRFEQRLEQRNPTLTDPNRVPGPQHPAARIEHKGAKGVPGCHARTLLECPRARKAEGKTEGRRVLREYALRSWHRQVAQETSLTGHAL